MWKLTVSFNKAAKVGRVEVEILGACGESPPEWREALGACGESPLAVRVVSSPLSSARGVSPPE